jgi:hypothetical protein
MFMFVNEAMLPFGRNGPFGYGTTYFYNGRGVANRGSACVTITRAGPLTEEVELNPTSLCPMATEPPAVGDWRPAAGRA